MCCEGKAWSWESQLHAWALLYGITPGLQYRSSLTPVIIKEQPPHLSISGLGLPQSPPTTPTTNPPLTIFHHCAHACLRHEFGRCCCKIVSRQFVADGWGKNLPIEGLRVADG